MDPEFCKLIADELRDGAVGDLLDFERLGEGGCHQVRIGNGGQTDELNAGRELVRNCCRQPQRQAGFSRSPGPVMVNSRTSGPRSSNSAASATCCSRPMSEVRGIGRSWRFLASFRRDGCAAPDKPE